MWRFSVLALIATAAAQIPSLGWCPDYQPMENFNMNRFLGTWFEVERYFTVTEFGSRCVTTKYEATPEGRIIVSNEITNAITGVKRVMDGHLQHIGPEGEGRIIVKYNMIPVPYDSEFSILGTDYDNYAVIWSCSGIGPVHTQNAWILTRDRIPNAAVLQGAYGVLDKFKISRTFFIKTDQATCTVLPDPAAQPVESSAKQAEEDLVLTAKHAGVVAHDVEKVVEKQVVEKPVEPVVAINKPELPQERVASPLPEEKEKKPMQVPELIMESAEKKEKFEKPEEPMKKEEKPMPQEEKPMPKPMIESKPMEKLPEEKPAVPQ